MQGVQRGAQGVLIALTIGGGGARGGGGGGGGEEGVVCVEEGLCVG